tara:strand:- start:2231 stop:2725 length:495 start_codon:yes stop_codon:yes gene_type:complete
MSILYGFKGYALIFFAIASIADGVDGYLARSRNEITLLGSILDPAADKILMLTAFLLLSSFNYLPVWLAILVIGRDIVLVLGFLILRTITTSDTIKPSFLGKTTTVLQMSTIIFVLLVSLSSDIKNLDTLYILFILTGMFTIVSGIHYLFFVGLRLIGKDFLKT